MLFSMIRGRMPFALLQVKTRQEQELARLTGYLGALR